MEGDPQVEGEPDIAFGASVRADSLRFRSAPQTEVAFHGTPGRRSVSRSTRTGLPAPVRPGERYEDVQVDYALASELTGDEEESRETHETEERGRETREGREREPEKHGSRADDPGGDGNGDGDGDGNGDMR
ncbi:hypothetical protein [Streptomyces albus]|uniref:hypothetical protein n=1 Tax=Streptomyces albus TaxID=1888 RepID=UPI0024ADD036|nr:hypothetical protein [Streptomyces albus]MDI6409909.1 hypothetical protein [Streptomyces albus]